MKPTTPIDREMIFLRDVEHRLDSLANAVASQGNVVPQLLGLRGVLNNRIAEVTELRDGGYECDGHNCPSRAHDHKPTI